MARVFGPTSVWPLTTLETGGHGDPGHLGELREGQRRRRGRAGGGFLCRGHIAEFS